MPTKPKLNFYTFSELFAAAWSTWVGLFPTYFRLLLPITIIEITYTFLLWKFPIAKGAGSFPRLLLESLLLFGFGAFHALVYYITFRDRKNKKPISLSETYQEAWKLFGGYLVEEFLYALLALGGWLLFFIPGVVFSVWFSSFGWLRVYAPDKKTTHFGESRALVRGNTWKVFLMTKLPNYVYLFGVILLAVHFSAQPGFTYSVPGLVKNLVMLLVAILWSSFLVTMNGLVFERLMKMKSSLKPEDITGSVVISVVGWVVGWLLMGILLVAMVAILHLGKRNIAPKTPAIKTASSSAQLKSFSPGTLK